METRGIHRVAQADPDRVALICSGVTMTYGRLDAMANQAAHAFAAQGVGPGDCVAVDLHNRSEVFAVWNAASRLGATVVPISYRLLGAEVGYILEDSGAALLVHDNDAVAEESLISSSRVRAAWHVEDPELWSGSTQPPRSDFLDMSVVAMTYTSGTTGRPKGVRKIIEPSAAGAFHTDTFVLYWGFRHDDVYLLTGPSYHGAPGGYAQVHLMEGAKVVIMPRFDAVECLRLIQEERVTTGQMVPANFIRILDAPWCEYDRSSVRLIIHTAAACPESVKRQAMEIFPPGSLWEFYGAIEGTCSAISPGEWRLKPGSVGRPFPGVHNKVLRDDGTAADPEEIGTIYSTGLPGWRFEYHDDPVKSAAAWKDSYFTVGDMGWIDDDGYLFIADRRTDLIISGGVNIYPAEIEQALIADPAVADAAVFGLPDEQMGHRVHAVVELRPGRPGDPDDLLAALATRLARYKLPRSIEFIDQLPREPNGKIRKFELRNARLATSGEQP